MSVYVIDASVVIEYLVTGPSTSNARALFIQATSDDRFIVPEFCLLECTNVLWRHVRFNGMPLPEAQRLLKHLKKLPLARVPAKASLDHALIIGLTYGLAVYDSTYIALAKKSNYPLITIDQKQLDAAAKEGVIVKPIADFKL